MYVVPDTVSSIVVNDMYTLFFNGGIKLKKDLLLRNSFYQFLGKVLPLVSESLDSTFQAETFGK